MTGFSERINKAMEDMVVSGIGSRKPIHKVDKSMVPNKTKGNEVTNTNKQQDVIPTQIPNPAPGVKNQINFKLGSKIQPAPKSTNKKEQKNKFMKKNKKNRYTEACSKYLNEGFMDNIKNAFAPDDHQKVANALGKISRIHDTAQKQIKATLDAIPDESPVKGAVLQQVQSAGIIDVTSDIQDFQKASALAQSQQQSTAATKQSGYSPSE
jgi:hypothetical protein